MSPAESDNVSADGNTMTSDQGVDLLKTAQELFAYFGAITEARRKSPQDDLSSVIANGMIDGQPIGEREAMSYYIIVATAGHDTTSSTASGGLRELIRRPGRDGEAQERSLAFAERRRRNDPLGDAGETLHADRDRKITRLSGKTIRKATGFACSTGRAIAMKQCLTRRSSSGWTAM